jgi:hypothetical protein
VVGHFEVIRLKVKLNCFDDIRPDLLLGVPG